MRVHATFPVCVILPINAKAIERGQIHWHGAAKVREGTFPHENPNHQALHGSNLLVAVAVAQAASSASLQELGFHTVSSG